MVFVHPLASRSVCLSLIKTISAWLYVVRTTSTYHKTKEEITEEIACVMKAQENPEYFGPIYEKYYDEIYVYVYKRIDEEYTTAEITSRIFYKCLSKIGGFKYMGVPFSAWLYRIAINEINQFFRKQKSHPRTVSVSDYQLENLFPEFTRLTPTTDKSSLIPKLLEHLSPGDLQMIELRFFEQKPFKEIAYLLDLTEVNAKVKTYRIIKKLQKVAKNINVDWDD